jgi:hypothetical protein
MVIYSGFNNSKNLSKISIPSREQIIFDREDENNNGSYNCDNEWEQLNNQRLYFKKNIAFYYTDLSKIRLGLIRDANLNLAYTLLVIIENTENKEQQNYMLTDIRVIDFKPFHPDIRTKSDKVRLEYIDADLKIKNNFNYLKMKVKIIADNNETISETKNLINLIIKPYNNNYNLIEKDSLICSSFYTHTPVNLEKSFEWWFEINKISGYDKIILYNHTFGSEFDSLFLKYNKLVQVDQYQCVPNLFTQNNNLKFIKFKDINGIDKFRSSTRGFRRILQIFVLNECYLMNKDKYKYITVIDSDEVIIPRQEYKRELNESFYQLKQSKSIQNCSSYLENIVKNINTNREAFSFSNGNYIHHETMNLFFNEFEKIIKLNTNNLYYNYTIAISDPKLSKNNIKIKIGSKRGFEYAQYLYKMHKKYVEPFLIENNETLSAVLEQFNRFYYLINTFSSRPMFRYNYGNFKTIHNTSHIDIISHHIPGKHLNKNSIGIPLSLGHLSHFRRSYFDKSDELNKEYNIKQLYFDFNYFSNYFKPILRNLFNKMII